MLISTSKKWISRPGTHNMTEQETAIELFVYKPNQPIETAKNLESLLSLGRENLGDLIPMDADVPRLIAEMKAVAAENPLIRGCTQHSLACAAGRAAITGLHIGGPMKQADIIPRKIKGVLTACFEPRYGGLISLACKSGVLKTVEAHVVYSNDEFDPALGTNGEIKHRPTMAADRGTRIAVYTILGVEGGQKQTTILRADEVQKRANVSKAKFKGCPWQEWTDEMWMKTGIKHAMNYAPMSSENMALMEAIQADNDVHGMDIQEPVEGQRADDVQKSAELPLEAADAARQAAADHDDVIDVEPT